MKVWLYPGSFRVPVWSGSGPCACQFLLTLTTRAECVAGSCTLTLPESMSGQSLPKSALSPSTSSFTVVFRRDENGKLFAFSPPDTVCWDSQAPLFSAPAAAPGRRCLPSVPDCTRAAGAHTLLYKSRGWRSRKELTLWVAAWHPLPCGKGIPRGG